jgi:hypothetical protein
MTAPEEAPILWEKVPKTRRRILDKVLAFLSDCKVEGRLSSLTLDDMAIALRLRRTDWKTGQNETKLWIWILFLFSKQPLKRRWAFQSLHDFWQLYPEYRSPLDTQEEVINLYTYANWVKLALNEIGGRGNKTTILKICARLAEGPAAVYVTGSGQSRFTESRVRLIDDLEQYEHRVKMLKSGELPQQEEKTMELWQPFAQPSPFSPSPSSSMPTFTHTVQPSASYEHRLSHNKPRYRAEEEEEDDEEDFFPSTTDLFSYSLNLPLQRASSYEQRRSTEERSAYALPDGRAFDNHGRQRKRQRRVVDEEEDEEEENDSFYSPTLHGQRYDVSRASLQDFCEDCNGAYSSISSALPCPRPDFQRQGSCDLYGAGMDEEEEEEEGEFDRRKQHALEEEEAFSMPKLTVPQLTSRFQRNSSPQHLLHHQHQQHHHRLSKDRLAPRFSLNIGEDPLERDHHPQQLFLSSAEAVVDEDYWNEQDRFWMDDSYAYNYLTHSNENSTSFSPTMHRSNSEGPFFCLDEDEMHEEYSHDLEKLPELLNSTFSDSFGSSSTN